MYIQMYIHMYIHMKRKNLKRKSVKVIPGGAKTNESF